MSAFNNEQTVYEPQRDVNVGSEKAVLNYIQNSLRATRPWTRLLSVLGFIGTALDHLCGFLLT
jgi:hypothetical protein